MVDNSARTINRQIFTSGFTVIRLEANTDRNVCLLPDSYIFNYYSHNSRGINCGDSNRISTLSTTSESNSISTCCQIRLR